GHIYNVDLFWQVNEVKNFSKKASNDEIIAVNYIFIDVDAKILGKSLNETYEYFTENFLNKLQIVPNVVVNSCGGFHFYFEVAESDRNKVEELRKIQKAIVKMATAFGADGSVSDLSRILRRPYSKNPKYPTLPINEQYAVIKYGEFREEPYTLAEFLKLEFTEFETIAKVEKVSIKRESLTVEMQLPEHPYFYELLKISGSRHGSLLKYAMYLKQNYYKLDEVIETLDKLAITVEAVGEYRKISTEEVTKIASWVFDRKVIHNYEWEVKVKSKLNKVKVKILNLANGDKYYLECLQEIISHIEKYGPSFFMSYSYFEEMFSKSTCLRLVKMLLEAGILELVESGGFVKNVENGETIVRKMANHYRLRGFSISILILEKIHKVMGEFKEEFKSFFRKIHGKSLGVIVSSQKFTNIGHLMDLSTIQMRC
ncbi:MAG: hypothetical protein WBP41_16580, partial [Saprospiraceae bacterium]